MAKTADDGNFVNDLVRRGVNVQTATAFYANTAVAAPTQVSENGQGGGNATPAPVYHGADGKVITEAQMQQMIKDSLAANPQAAGSNGTTFSGGQTWDGASADPNGVGPIDWHQYLTDWGFDKDITDELDRIFRTYNDPQQAGAAALAYVRGTDWYKRTFPGIQEGQRLGVIGDEASYRDYVNRLNQEWRRYYGRDITTQEASDFLKQGKNVQSVGAHLQGGAYINANRNDIQYQLGAFDENGQASESDLSDYGDQLSGLGNAHGAALQARLDKAKERLNRIMQGTLATPSLTAANGGLSSASGAKTPDVAA